MSRPFDATLKELLDAFSADWVSWIAPQIGLPADVQVEPVDADLSTISPEADKIFRLCPPQDGFLHLEPQSSWDETAPSRFLLYNVLIEHRLGGPVYTVALLLRREAQAKALTGQLIRRYFSGEIYHDFRYTVIRVWELPAEVFLQSGIGTLPLALLTDDAEAKLSSLVSRIEARLQSEKADQQTTSTIWTAIYLLLGLRYDKDTIAQLLRGVQAMEESVTYQEILLKGKQKGLAEGRHEGYIEASKDDVLSLLTERFGVIPEPLEQQIRSATDAERLKAALRQIVRIQTIEEFKL